ncbi:MAG: alpha/beta fold hydrolase [candidate division NC10 bacterium]|nr:alpha/beta fold hydrolase [candidate division NC10 bacterium]MDE2322690.1 alpha/beta fold hydrolase [candidate division NC10 bacterium]
MRRPPATQCGPLDEMVGRRPTDLAIQTRSQGLVYLIHGVTGTPTEMSYLGRRLARNGWDVYATTLPGHCTRIRDLLKTSEHDWITHVQEQLAFVRERYNYLYVAGLSAGALLALQSSVTVDVDALGVLSPTFIYDGWNTPRIRALLPFVMKVAPLHYLLFHADGPPFGIKDEQLQAHIRAAYHPLALMRGWIRDRWAQWKNRGADAAIRANSAASKGYPIFPLKTLSHIDRLIARVRGRLGEVTAPTVILQAREDDMTGPRNGELVYNTIASQQKHLILLDDCYHVITVDKQRRAVANHLIEFFGRQTSRLETHQLA